METQASFNSSIETIRKLSQALQTVVRGRKDTIELILAALAADGHVLLEDYPGSGKTVLSKTLGRLIEHDPRSLLANFKRIQFTPDMLPGDVLGVNIFDPNTAQFKFIQGPVFANIVLADEINRAGPKVQAAFLECMAEKQVTIDSVSHALDSFFFVIGTQNPLDIAGTYPLPLVQLDRFLIKIPMSYVDKKTEIEILEEHSQIIKQSTQIEPVCSKSDIIGLRESVKEIHVSDVLREAIVDIIQSTRNNPKLQFGASTRAAVMLQAAMRGMALVREREFATEDDLKTMLPFVLGHRIKFLGTGNSQKENLEELVTPVLRKLTAKY